MYTLEIEWLKKLKAGKVAEMLFEYVDRWGEDTTLSQFLIGEEKVGFFVTNNPRTAIFITHLMSKGVEKINEEKNS